MIKVCKTLLTVFTTLSLVFLTIIHIPNWFGYTPYVVKTDSMQPILKPGTVIYIDVNDQNFQEGDIITFNKSGVLITHRVISIKGNQVITKGDNNIENDKFEVYESDIIGKYIFSVPIIGFLIKNITKGIEYVLFVMTLCAWTIWFKTRIDRITFQTRSFVIS